MTYLILTVITIWYDLTIGWHAFDRAFSWGNFTAWRVLLLSPPMLVLYILWLAGLFLGLFLILMRGQAQIFFYNTVTRRSLPGGTILKLIDIPLWAGGIGLAVYGGTQGQLGPLLLGTMLAFGLLLHFGEQWLRERFL